MKNTLTFFAFFILCSSLVIGQNTQERTTLHYITFATTNDGTIGSGNNRSLELLDSLMSQIEYLVVDSIAHYEFFNDDFEAANIDILTDSLRNEKAIKTNDVIFFYFLGHGENNGNDIFPDLAFQGNSKTTDEETPTQNLEDIGFKLKDLGARLTLVFAEACNNFPNDSPTIENKNGNSIVSDDTNENPNKKRLSDLFLYSKGYVIMSSSDLNQFSFVHKADGGIFTQIFCKNMFKYISKSNRNINWHDVLENTKMDVGDFSKKINLPHKPIQNPFYSDKYIFQDIPPKERVKTTKRIAIQNELVSIILPKKNIDNFDSGLTAEKRQRHHKENPFAYYMIKAILAEYKGNDSDAFVYYSISNFLDEKNIKEDSDLDFIEKLEKLDKDYLEFGFTRKGIVFNEWLVMKLNNYKHIQIIEPETISKIQKIKTNIITNRQ